jgi:hypothetical protein
LEKAVLECAEDLVAILIKHGTGDATTAQQNNDNGNNDDCGIVLLGLGGHLIVHVGHDFYSS